MKKKLTAVIAKGKDKLFYVSLVSRNGYQVWHTGDGYKQKASAIKAINILKNFTITKIIFK